MIPFKHSISPLKEKLKKRQLTIGTWLTIPHRTVVEILAKSGFEWVVIDMEHAPINISQTVSSCRRFCLMVSNHIQLLDWF